MEIINDRSDLVNDVIYKCLNEMYLESQPSISLEEILKKQKENPQYQYWEQHYLPTNIYNYILDKYKKIYHIYSEWDDDINIIKEYLSAGGTIDKWIPDYIDEYGHHSGHRGYEKLPPLITQFTNILKTHNIQDTSISQELYDAVLKTIQGCQDFFAKNNEEMSFMYTIATSAPCSNMQNVKDYWDSHDPNISIRVKKRIYDEEMDDYIYIYEDK